MNWKKVGWALVVWALAGGVLALGMAVAPDASVGAVEKANWAIECFQGSPGACDSTSEHRLMVAEWKSRAWVAGGIAGTMLVIGLSLVAGGARTESGSSK